MKTTIFLAMFLGLTAMARADGPLPVVAAPDYASLLPNKDPHLAANKKAATDFYRIVLKGRRLEHAAEFLREDYIQHNPNVDTGLKGFLAFFAKLGGPRDIPATLPGLVAIQAEGDFVTLSFVDAHNDGAHPYTTTAFDMFRFAKDGKIAEHWDNDTLSSP